MIVMCRQFAPAPNSRRPSRRLVLTENHSAEGLSRPVSYTHLDVYKRQNEDSDEPRSSAPDDAALLALPEPLKASVNDRKVWVWPSTEVPTRLILSLIHI